MAEMITEELCPPQKQPGHSFSSEITVLEESRVNPEHQTIAVGSHIATVKHIGSADGGTDAGSREDEQPLPDQDSSNAKRKRATVLAILKASAIAEKDGYYGSDSQSSFWLAVNETSFNVHPEDQRDNTPLSLASQAESNLPLHPYVYQRFGSATEIRLLEIVETELSSGDVGAPMICRLHVVDLAHSPQYTALSYTWGLPQNMYATLKDKPDIKSAHARCHQIICDDHSLMVTKNLYDALGVLRTQQPAQYVNAATAQEAPRLHWIDAICIDQQHLEERNAQVEMMGQIYKKAQLVFIWLGPHNWYSWPAIHCLGIIGELYRRFGHDDLSAVEIYNEEWWRANDFGDLLGEEDRRPHWESLYLYLQHTWFRRSWIVQEVSFARCAFMLCGETCIPWSYFAGCCHWLERQGWHLQMEKTRRWLVDGIAHSRISARLTGASRRDIIQAMPAHLAEWDHFFVGRRQLDLPITSITDVADIRAFCQAKQLASNEKHPTMLRETLERFRSFDETDGKDKIYAFLSIPEHVLLSRDEPGRRDNSKDEIEDVAMAKGDLLQNNAKVITGLAKYYRSTHALDQVARDLAQAKTSQGLMDEILAEDFLEQLNRRKGDAGAEMVEEGSVNLDTNSIEQRTQAVKRRLRGSIPLVASPRIQSKVEALWRTLLLDYCDEDPAPLSFGFAMGDWIARRVEEAYLPYLAKRDHATRSELEAELQVWLALDAAEPAVSDANVAWPADTMQDAEKLQEYAQNDFLAAYMKSTYLHWNHERGPMGEDLMGGIRMGQTLAACTAPIRFIPTWEQLKEYLCRALDTNYAQTRGSRQARFFKQYNKYNPGRGVFVTKGGWMGNGHQSARRGDQVWLLPHCTVPFILRPRQEEETQVGNGDHGRDAGDQDVWEDVEEGEQAFQMIGACYVHGLMHREGVPGMGLGDLRSILIE